jgi:hypothetical protein
VTDSLSALEAVYDTFTYDTVAEEFIFEFTVTGVGVIPEENSVYSNNGSRFVTQSTEISGAAGTITMRRLNNYENDPSASGTLTKISGTGDASITFSSVSDESEYDGITYSTTWWDILKLGSVYENAFILAKPKDDAGTLKIDLSLIPRAEQAGGSEIDNITWIERKKIEKEYIVDGVTLSLTNYDYELGDTSTRNQFSRSVPCAEPVRPNSNWYADLYMGMTEQNLAGGGYDYTQPDDLFYEAGVGSPLLDSIYNNIISGLDGYQGKILPYYDDGGDVAVRLLDQIELADTSKMQVIYIKIQKRGFASIKAMELS